MEVSECQVLCNISFKKFQSRRYDIACSQGCLLEIKLDLKWDTPDRLFYCSGIQEPGISGFLKKSLFLINQIVPAPSPYPTHPHTHIYTHVKTQIKHTHTHKYIAFTHTEDLLKTSPLLFHLCAYTTYEYHDQDPQHKISVVC